MGTRKLAITFQSEVQLELGGISRVEDTPTAITVEVPEMDRNAAALIRSLAPDAVQVITSRSGNVDAYIRVGEPCRVRLVMPYPWTQDGKEEDEVWGVVLLNSRSVSVQSVSATLIVYPVDRVFRLDGQQWTREG